MGSLFYSRDNYEHISIISNCSFYQNSADFSLIDVDLSIFHIINSTFVNNTNIGFYIIQSSLLLMSNITFSNHQCEILGGCILSLKENSTLILTSSSFENTHNFQDEANFFVEFSNATFDRIKMKNVSNANEIGACLSSFSSNIAIISSYFDNYSFNCIYSTTSIFSIENSFFSNKMYKNNKSLKKYGIIYCLSCNRLNILNSSFECSLNNLMGGGICLINNMKNSSSQQFLISRNVFSINTAFYGGAIYLYNADTIISSNLFEKNIAEQGGAIFLNNDGN